MPKPMDEESRMEEMLKHTDPQSGTSYEEDEPLEDVEKAVHEGREQTSI